MTGSEVTAGQARTLLVRGRAERVEDRHTFEDVQFEDAEKEDFDDRDIDLLGKRERSGDRDDELSDDDSSGTESDSEDEFGGDDR